MADTKPHSKASINNLKSIIAKRGVAKTNRFEIDLSSIGTVIDASTTDIRDLEVLVTSAQLPTRSLTTFDYGLYRNNVSFPTGFVNSDFSISFTLTQDYFARTMFDKWLNKIITKKDYLVAYPNQYKCDIGVRQLANDKDETIIYEAKLTNCFPKGVSELGFDSSGTGAATLSVSFLYDDLELPEDS
tara:strand:- start:16290 stop:16850 length:561 start_codon:yes stop_codon:yes gene_type:complete